MKLDSTVKKLKELKEAFEAEIALNAPISHRVIDEWCEEYAPCGSLLYV